MINWKVALLLVAVLVGLAVYAFQSRPQPKPAKPTPALFPCAAADAVDLRISSPDGKLTELHLAFDGTWQQTAPVAASADPAAVSDLLLTASTLQSSDTLRAVPAGQDLGLSPPRLTVLCALRKGASYTLTVGGQNFDGSGSYARVSGDSRVHVIPSAAVQKFQKVLLEPPIRRSPSPAGSPSPSPSA